MLENSPLITNDPPLLLSQCSSLLHSILTVHSNFRIPLIMQQDQPQNLSLFPLIGH